MPTSAEPLALAGRPALLSPICFRATAGTPSRGFLPDDQRLPAPSSCVGRMVECVLPGAPILATFREHGQYPATVAGVRLSDALANFSPPNMLQGTQRSAG